MSTPREPATSPQATAPSVAIVGMALTGAWIVARPDPVALAAGASLSLAVSALIFPLCSSSLRPFILELAEATAAIWTRPLKIS